MKRDKPMCYGEAKHVRNSMTQDVINNAVRLDNGRLLFNQVMSKLKTEKPKIRVNDRRYTTIVDRMNELKFRMSSLGVKF